MNHSANFADCLRVSHFPKKYGGNNHKVHSQSFIFASNTACVRLNCNGVTVM